MWSDGACEGRDRAEVGYGAVMYDPVDGATEAFGCQMTDELRDLISQKNAQKQFIGQAELMPLLASRTVWKERMRDRDVIHYVDNEGANNLKADTERGRLRV